MCSGQSNADCPIWGGNPRYRDGLGGLTLQMTRKPWVRLVKTTHTMALGPKTDYKAKWLKMVPESFSLDGKPQLPSAMGYYFALELANALEIPIGLVDSSVGGTSIDAWTPRCGYDGKPGFDLERNWEIVSVSAWTNTMRRGPITGPYQQPSTLWYGMVAAYAPMAVRGVIWYQGCHNVSPKEEASRHCAKLHALYDGWAREFANPDIKWYLVELAPFESHWFFDVRCQQAKFAAEEKNAALAVINDAGNLKDIHPNDKRTVAKRLAAHALRRDYGWNGIRDESPTLVSATAEGETAVLSFRDVERWYVYNPSRDDTAIGFELAGTNGVYVSAEVVNFDKKKWILDGTNVILRAKGVVRPAKVRYLWERPWYGSLLNEVGLPVGSFESEVR